MHLVSQYDGMRLTLPASIARFGDIEIRGLQQVLELEAHETTSRHDGGAHNKRNGSYGYYGSQEETQAVYSADLQAVQARTAIVVPCKYESIARMRGVWAAIPANSLIIVVSGSAADAYAEERDAFKTFCAVTRRSGICVNQGDPQLAAALGAVGMGALLDDRGLVHKGKGEGMVIGTMLAAIAEGPTCHQNGTVASKASPPRQGQGGSTSRVDGNIEVEAGASTTTTRCDDDCLCAGARSSSGRLGCGPIKSTNTLCCCIEAQSHGQPIKPAGSCYYRYIGFIDADNYVPGSVQEYCKAFSAGLALAEADDAMVRINWPAKPKIKDGRLEFQPSGRCSQVVNRWLNRLLRNLGARAAGDDAVGDCEDDEDEADEGVHLGQYDGAPRGPDHICTGNAGEHAMSMSLALKLRLANGYAIEPFHFLDMLERLAGDTSQPATNDKTGPEELKRLGRGSMGRLSPTPIAPLPSPLVSLQNKASPRPRFACSPDREGDSPPISRPPAVVVKAAAANNNPALITDITPPVSPTFPRWAAGPAKVQIFQVRTLSAHFHDNKGEVHVVRMWQQGLAAIYHSPLAAALTKYRHDLRTAIFAGDYSVRQLVDDGDGGGPPLMPTPPPTHGCVSAVATPPDVGAADDDDEEDRGAINGAAVEAAASWQPERCRVYPAPGSVDLAAFRTWLTTGQGSFWCNNVAS